VEAKSFREREGEEHYMDRERSWRRKREESSCSPRLLDRERSWRRKREESSCSPRLSEREEKPEPSDMSRANEPRLFRSLQ
jgi:hypothetical protein